MSLGQQQLANSAYVPPVEFQQKIDDLHLQAVLEKVNAIQRLLWVQNTKQAIVEINKLENQIKREFRIWTAEKKRLQVEIASLELGQKHLSDALDLAGGGA